jgi:hypothetical protein
MGVGGEVLVTRDRPDRSIPAAVLAALAESGILFLVVKLLTSNAVHPTVGPLVSFPLFVLMFTAAVAAATAVRWSTNVATVAAGAAIALGLAQGRVWAHGSLEGAAAVVLVSLLLALRVVSLARRDWRNPVTVSFGWGTVALLIEIIAADGVGHGWNPLLTIVVPQFFLANLASRAASVRLALDGADRKRPTDGEPAAGQAESRRRQTAFLLAAFGVALAVAVIMTRGGGVVRAMGNMAVPLVGGVLVGGVYVLVTMSRPILWLATKFHINVKDAQEFIDRLKPGRATRKALRPAGHPTATARLIGLVVIAAIIYLLVRLIRRYQGRLEWHTRAGEAEAEGEAVPLPAEPPPRRRWWASPGRTLPADVVRRWYAETLMLLESKGVAREPFVTPGEFVAEVGRQFPECRAGFAELTRGYEEVRYGRRTFPAEQLKRLRARRDTLVGWLRRAPVPEVEDEEVEGEGDDQDQA